MEFPTVAGVSTSNESKHFYPTSIDSIVYGVVSVVVVDGVDGVASKDDRREGRAQTPFSLIRLDFQEVI